MLNMVNIAENGLASKVRRFFRSREIFVHDGATMRRIHISGRAQALVASATTAAIGVSLLGTAQLAGATPAVISAVSSEVAVHQMQTRIDAMRSDVESIRQQAVAHAAMLDQRQAFLDAVLTANGAPAIPAKAQKISSASSDAIVPFGAVEAKQIALAERAVSLVDARYRAAEANLARIGIHAGRIVADKTAMGGPYEPVDAAKANAAPDPAFRALFQSWKRLDRLQQGVVAIPSQKPVDQVDFTSGFGVRSDPFRGTSAMHAGLDLRGAYGTPIHATADGVVSRAGWANGYGNLVELDHGRGIQTRYGHLSAILVQPGQRVKRGDQIARMGSTGRSTGNHLHYEVRLDGSAVNPMPFLQGAEYLASISPRGRIAVGGPAQPVK